MIESGRDLAPQTQAAPNTYRGYYSIICAVYKRRTAWGRPGRQKRAAANPYGQDREMTISQCENCEPQPAGKTCRGCEETVPAWARYCPLCGRKFEEAAPTSGDPPDMENRRLCPDGNCIGILGADGRCIICGKS
jgi:hypothetical protein